MSSSTRSYSRRARGFQRDLAVIRASSQSIPSDRRASEQKVRIPASSSTTRTRCAPRGGRRTGACPAGSGDPGPARAVGRCPVNGSSARMTASAVAYRSAGATAIILARTASSCAGNSGRSDRADGGGCVSRCCRSWATLLVNGNGSCPGQRPEERRPEAVDVGPLVHRRRVLGLLRGHVAERAEHRARLGQAGPRGRAPGRNRAAWRTIRASPARSTA